MVDLAKRSLRLAAVIVVAGLVAAGCTSGQASTEEPGPTTTTSESAATTSTEPPPTTTSTEPPTTTTSVAPSTTVEPTTTTTTEPAQTSSTEPVEALASEQFCNSLVIAIEDSDQAFDREPGEDPDLDRQLVALLRDLSAGRPEGAPDLLSDLLESAASGVELSVRFADGEDVATIAADAEVWQERVRATDWDPAEDWVEAACGIDVLGIQLMVRDDDRVVSSAE